MHRNRRVSNMSAMVMALLFHIHSAEGHEYSVSVQRAALLCNKTKAKLSVFENSEGTRRTTRNAGDIYFLCNNFQPPCFTKCCVSAPLRHVSQSKGYGNTTYFS